MRTAGCSTVVDVIYGLSLERGVKRPPEAEVDGGGDVGQVEVVPRAVPEVAREERPQVAHAVRVEEVGHVEVVDLEADGVAGRGGVVGDVEAETEKAVLEGGPVDGHHVDLDALDGGLFSRAISAEILAFKASHSLVSQSQAQLDRYLIQNVFY